VYQAAHNWTLVIESAAGFSTGLHAGGGVGVGGAAGQAEQGVRPVAQVLGAGELAQHGCEPFNESHHNSALANGQPDALRLSTACRIVSLRPSLASSP
jgi:hypothetical protein